jgi:hypothetical protein
MRGIQSGMIDDQTKENFPDSQISPLKLENASPSLLGANRNPNHSCIGIMQELKGIRSELTESMHKLKVFSATTAAGIPHADGESFSALFLEISELVARMNVTEAKAGAALEAQIEQFVSHHELKTTVLRGFENDLMIDSTDNSVFVTRKANLISVIHELSRRNVQSAKDLYNAGDTTSTLLLEASWQKQLAQQQIQIGSLQHQLEEQISHLRMAAGNCCFKFD